MPVCYGWPSPTGVSLFIVGLLLWKGHSGDPAVCMCHCGQTVLPNPQAQAKLDAYVQSQEFILTILKRKPKYAPLVPEAINFWHPTIGSGTIDNNNVRTDLDGSYQPLFLDLREDIYAELSYLEGAWYVKPGDLESIRSGCARLDMARSQNPALDLSVPIEEALQQAQENEPVRTRLRAVLDAARHGKSLEAAVGEAH